MGFSKQVRFLENSAYVHITSVDSVDALRGAKLRPSNNFQSVLSRGCYVLLRDTTHPAGGGGGGGGGYSNVGSAGIFWFKILNFNIFGGFQFNEYFWGYEDFVDIFFFGWGSSQNRTIFRGHFSAFWGLFLRQYSLYQP